MNSETLLKIADEIETDPLFQTRYYFDAQLPRESCGCAVGRIAVAGGGVLEIFPKDESEMAQSWNFHYKRTKNLVCEIFAEIMNISKDDAVSYASWTIKTHKEKIVQSIRMMADGTWEWSIEPLDNFKEDQNE